MKFLDIAAAVHVIGVVSGPCGGGRRASPCPYCAAALGPAHVFHRRGDVGVGLEQAATQRMSGHPDSKETLAAFRERRDPSYRPLDRDAAWYGI